MGKHLEHATNERKRGPARSAAIVTGALALTAVLIAGAEQHGNNNQQLSHIAAITKMLMQTRTSCSILDRQATVDSEGDPALLVTIGFEPDTALASYNAMFDAFGMDVTFADETNGLLKNVIIDSTDTVVPPVHILVDAEPGLPGGRRTLTIPAYALSSGMANYTLSVPGTVTAHVRGWLVSQADYSASGLEHCGTIAYGYQPVNP